MRKAVSLIPLLLAGFVVVAGADGGGVRSSVGATAGIQEAVANGKTVAELKEELFAAIEARGKLTQEIVDSIFSFSELGYQEYWTSEYVTGILRDAGFRVTTGQAGMPTAFDARWGSGRPIIGLQTDIDGLPETSQKPGVAYHDPLIPGGPGHGEGHNSGMAVVVTAALALQEIMEANGIPGTISITPGVAEELVGSRNYMVRADMFSDLDAMIQTHVSSGFTTNWGESSSGLVSTMYTFHGQSAHGASSPWAGRSALDAVELMDVAWNFRREHLRLQQRSHSVIYNGGNQPNVVPSEATVWYYFRELDYRHIVELHEIGTTLAEAAAMMTGTTVTERIVAATWQRHYNKPIAEALYENIALAGMPEWSEADQEMARAVQRMMGREDPRGLSTEVGSPPSGPQGVNMGGGSDDIAEVSWNLPTVGLRYPANISGTTGHHWSSGIAMATPIAHKGSTAGAKATAATVIDLLTRPQILEAAREYFEEQTRDTKWESLIPDGVVPMIEIYEEKMARYRPELERLRYDPSQYSNYLEQLGITYPTVRASDGSWPPTDRR